MRRLLAGLALTAAIGLLAGCGADGEATGAAASPRDAGGPLIVSAASSLTDAFERYGQGFDDGQVRFSFAGSDELAAQIRQGVKPDVFASANTSLPDALHAEGLVGAPRVFAANQLVQTVRFAGDDITSIDDMQRPGVKLAIGSATVPIGAYTHEVFNRLGASERAAILANVRSEETEVSSVVAKLEQGAADAGFVYVTDEKGAEGLEPVQVPAQLQPTVTYTVAVVSDSDAPDAAEEFVEGLVDGPGQEDLREAGFLSPP